jgi:hypothetical protein
VLNLGSARLRHRIPNHKIHEQQISTWSVATDVTTFCLLSGSQAWAISLKVLEIWGSPHDFSPFFVTKNDVNLGLDPSSPVFHDPAFASATQNR